MVNVDPGMEAAGVGWPCDTETMRKLNRGSKPTSSCATRPSTGLGSRPVASTGHFRSALIQHLTRRDMRQVMSSVFRCLKPGGVFILTIDLFLNLQPFTSRKSNQYGWNQNVRALGRVLRIGR